MDLILAQLGRFLLRGRSRPKRSKRMPPPSPPSSMVDWSQIQDDLLLSIFSKLQILDMVRSATVCSSWSAVVRELFSHQLHFRHLSLRHMSPWLMFSVSGEEKSSSSASAISLSDQEMFTIPIPEPPLRDRFCIGSSHGWLIASNQQSELQMLNPITGVQIDLPPVATLDRVKPIVDQQGCISGYLVLDDPYPPADYGVEELGFYLYWKAFLSSDPSLGDYTVVLVHAPHQGLSFTRAGDNKWTTLSNTPPLYEDATFYQGKFYTVTTPKKIEVWDLSAPCPTPTLVVPVQNCWTSAGDFNYLVRSPFDELLHVWRSKNLPDSDDDGNCDEDDNCDEEDYRYRTRVVKVFKVDIEGGVLVPVSKLEDFAIFLGNNNSVCLPCAYFPALKANSIYMTEDDLENSWTDKYKRRDIGVYNLEDDNFSYILSRDAPINWPPPVWLTHL